MQSLMIPTQSHRRQTPCLNADRRTERAEFCSPGTGSASWQGRIPRRTPQRHMAPRGPVRGPRVDGSVRAARAGSAACTR